ncbi:MAG: NAD(P)-dependent alcohol dehydrogenase [Bacteroidales bacterium]
MRAVYINGYGGPEELVYGELDDSVPGKNEVLIRVAAAAVNPVDWKIREGRLKIITGKNFPMIMGVELSGNVVSVGKDVTDLNPGDRVFAGLSHQGGAYAELVAVDRGKVSRIPDELPFIEASTLAVAGVTPLQAFTLHYHLQPGDEVLINGGSGGLGTYAIQIAKVLGARVTAICSERNIELVKRLGADEVIDYNQENFRSRKNAFNVIIDAASNASFSNTKQCLKRGGMLIKLNLSPGALLVGLWSRLFLSRKMKLILLKNRPEDIQWMIDRVAEGKISVVVDRIYSLGEAGEAQEYSQSGRARGKIVLAVDDQGAGKE